MSLNKQLSQWLIKLNKSKYHKTYLVIINYFRSIPITIHNTKLILIFKRTALHTAHTITHKSLGQDK